MNVQPKDVSGLAKAIQDLLENPGLRETMGRYGRQMVADGFSEQAVVSATLDLYRRLLEQPTAKALATAQRAGRLS